MYFFISKLLHPRSLRHGQSPSNPTCSQSAKQESAKQEPPTP